MQVTPAQLAELLEEYWAVGTRRVYLRTFDLDDLGQLELVAATAPTVRDGADGTTNVG